MKTKQTVVFIGLLPNVAARLQNVLHIPLVLLSVAQFTKFGNVIDKPHTKLGLYLCIFVKLKWMTETNSQQYSKYIQNVSKVWWI